MPSQHYLNQCQFMVNCNLWNKLPRNSDQNATSFILKDVFEYIICKMLHQFSFTTPYISYSNMTVLHNRGQWQLKTIYLNSLCAKFFRGNKNIYLHFMALLHIDKTHVVVILPHVRQGLTYPTWSISWLLMTWWRKEPAHQQPQYSLCWTELD